LILNKLLALFLAKDGAINRETPPAEPVASGKPLKGAMTTSGQVVDLLL